MTKQPNPKHLARWEAALSELEVFFKDRPLPAGPIRLSVCETITNPKLFVSSHIAVARANMGINTYAPYVSRLLSFQKFLTKQ